MLYAKVLSDRTPFGRSREEIRKISSLQFAVNSTFSNRLHRKLYIGNQTRIFSLLAERNDDGIIIVRERAVELQRVKKADSHRGRINERDKNGGATINL